MLNDPRLHAAIAQHRYPLLFVTVSGAHLYGFPSPDSDYDLRGAHALPLREVVGLREGPETIEETTLREGLEIDLVTHDLKKFFGMLLRRNGYVLEQLTSPLVVVSSPEHEELRSLARRLVTRHHGHHYLGFAAKQWDMFERSEPRMVKPLLYVYRVLLTGIHLMRSGAVEANLQHLNESFRLAHLPELIARKLSGPEHGVLDDADVVFHRSEYERLRGDLERAMRDTALPDAPGAADELDALLIRLRLGEGSLRQ